MNELHITQNLKIKQTLSQKMIQSVGILQMNAQELAEYVSALSLENPMVELENEITADEQEMRLRKLEWLAGMDEQNRVYYNYDHEDSENSGFMENISGRRTETLSDVLHLQLLSGHYTPQEMRIFDYMIASVDSKGYLSMQTEDVAETFGISVEDASTFFGILRDLEPDGICAKGPRECLLKKKKKKGEGDWEVERAIINEYMELAAKNKLPAISQKLGQPLERIVTALERIRELNPIPAQGFDTGGALHYATPDITVVKFEDRFEILLNEYAYPKIRVNKYYLKLMRSDCDGETKKYLSEKLRQIEETRGYIEHRGSTLMGLAKFLVERQKGFFEHGEQAIRPLKMKDAAEALEVHESTISRAVRGKYLQCSWGLYPLNYFFSAGIAGEDKEEVSSRKIRQEIRKLIEEEDTRKPYSDQKLCDLLQEKGIAVSRRTVAKYREEMGIGSTRERKSWT